MNWQEYYMRHAYLAADKSKDPKTKIGAVLVKDNRLISSGFNGFPYGVKDTADRYEDRELKHKLVVHAEANAVLQGALMGHSTHESTLYTPGIPCCECMKSVIQGGIVKIVVHKQWPNLTHSPKWMESFKIAEMMMRESGITLDYFDGKLGLVGLLDGKEIHI